MDTNENIWRPEFPPDVTQEEFISWAHENLTLGQVANWKVIFTHNLACSKKPIQKKLDGYIEQIRATRNTKP